jgi:hypothetical protein
VCYYPDFQMGKKVGMARTLNKLSDAAAKAARKPGRHSDGGGLYLNVSPTGTKSWLFIWARDGKRREMGLGAYPAVTLAVSRVSFAARGVELVRRCMAGLRAFPRSHQPFAQRELEAFVR